MQVELAKLDDKAIRDLRTGFNSRVREMGGISTEAVKAKSATQQFTEALVRQDITVANAYKNRKLFNEVLREQYQLQKMTAVQWGRSASGTVTADVMIPRGTDDAVNRLTSSWKANAVEMAKAKTAMLSHKAGTVEATAATERFAVANQIMRMRMGMATDMLSSFSTNMVKWGKNTQWAGRQLMVGFTVPFVAFAAVAGIAANNVDKEMTRILKVYDYSAAAAKDSALRAAEAETIRTRSLDAARQAAQQYGVSMQDTLDVEAELAATGMQGNDLIARTLLLNKAMIMGELDKQQAIKASTALQTAYGHSTAQISEDMNYMATIANATSLSMSDFVAALPRGAATLKNVGVNLQGLGVLLTSLKQSGVEAGEGMNALRSGAQKLLQPTKKAETFWKSYLPDAPAISEIVDRYQGQLIPVLDELGSRMQGLDKYQKQQIITNLFGIHRADSMYKVMDGLINKTNQVGKALEVSQMSADQLAQVAANSLATVTNSASNKIKRSIETIKAELVGLGAEFLPIAAAFMQGVGGVLRFINGLSEGKKKLIIFSMGFMAVAGVVTMMIGLLSNFMGTMLGAMTSLSKLAIRYRTVTLEQRAQQMLAEKNSALWRDQGVAAQTLATQLQLLTRSLDGVTVAQDRLALANMTGGGVVSQYKGTQQGKPGPNIPAGTPVVINGSKIRPATQAEVDMSRKVAQTEAIAQNELRAANATAASKRNWGAIAGSTAAVAVAGGLIATSLDNAQGASHGIMGNLMNTLLIASLLGPTIAKGFRTTAVTSAVSNLKGAFTVGKAGGGIVGSGGVVAGLRAALPAAKALVGTFARFAGPAGLLLTAVLTIKSIRDGMEDARKKQIAINDSAKQWAQVLGFTYQTSIRANSNNKSVGENAQSLAQKFRAANSEVAKQLDLIKQTGTQEELVNAAINEGVKARMHGADAGQARLAVATALATAGKSQQEIDKLMVTVDAKIDFKDANQVAQKQGEEFGKTFSEAANGQIESSRWMTRLWESVRGGLTSGAKQAAENTGKEFWNAFDSREGEQAKKDYFSNVAKDFNKQTDSIVNSINKGQHTNLNWEDIVGIYNRDKQASPNQPTIFDSFTKEQQDNVKNYADSLQIVVKTFAEQRGLAPSVISNLHTMSDLQKAIGIRTMDTSSAVSSWQQEMKSADANGKRLNETEKLAILNKWRLSAGLNAAKDVAQGFGAELYHSADALERFSAEAVAAAMSAEEWGSAWTDATKNALSNAQSAAMDQAEALRAQQQSDILQGIDDEYQRKQDAADAAAEAQNKRFEDRADALSKKYDNAGNALDERQKARQKAVAASYDNRIKKVQDAIDAEKKAEEIRQRIFEAEKTRLDRLAQMSNSNIDLNVAINTGSLDEAAKLFNDMQNQQSQWALEDATTGSSDASDARQAAQQKQIDSIGNAKDAALEALKKKEDAEKQALKDKQDREKKALDAEKARYQKATDANKKNLQKQNADARASMERFLADKKHTLDMELLTIRASTPKNKAEYDKQIAQIEAAYNRYGLRLKGYGNQWTNYIGDYLTSNVAAAAASLQNDINWKAYAQKIANDFSTGAFNMSVTEFGKWITTGKAPNDAFTIPKSNVNSTQAGAHGPGGSHEVRHEGGLLGTGGGNSRRGYPVNAGTYPSEINLLAQRGEYVVQKKAVNRLGTDVLDQINSGVLPMGGGDIGLAGVMAGGLAGQLKNMMQMGMLAAAMRQSGMQSSASTGSAGSYGKVALNADQLRNAATIMGVGKSLGASQRDLVIAIMTAMQESTLRNISYGDRDSLGLFQQRPSQGWGTATEIMDPTYASTKFFKELFKVNGRDKMPMTLAAQAVQRSAFPYAYAKWQDMAQALVSGTQFSTGSMGIADMLKALPLMMSGNGNGKPLSKYVVSSEYGMRVNPVTGAYKLHDGIDLAAASGTPIYAIKSGKVLSAGYAGGYGNYVVIAHPDGTQSGYAHQSQIKVLQGQNVSQGQVIGSVGSTGNSTGPHLHFQMGRGGNWQNPRDFIPGLRKGGYTLNDGYAMLHKNETVLTADLSDKLNTGLNNLAMGGNTEYNITVDLRGAFVNKEIDIKKAVYAAIDERESKIGRSRKVSA